MLLSIVSAFNIFHPSHDIILVQGARSIETHLSILWFSMTFQADPISVFAFSVLTFFPFVVTSHSVGVSYEGSDSSGIFSFTTVIFSFLALSFNLLVAFFCDFSVVTSLTILTAGAFSCFLVLVPDNSSILACTTAFLSAH